MSGTLPKPVEKKEKKEKEKKEMKEEAKEEKTVVPPLPLITEDDQHSAEQSGGHGEEEEEQEEEQEKAEEPLPDGWSEGRDAEGRTFYWSVRNGKVSFDRPRGAESDREDRSTHSQSQTAGTHESIPSTTRTEKTQGGATTDRKKNQPVDQFEKLLREQMFNRQLKEVLQLGDKELLRAVIVRYEDSRQPPGERQKNDDDDDGDYDDDDDDKKERRNLNDSKKLLRAIDYFYHLIREQVLCGHWLQSIATAGKGQGGGGVGATRGRGAGRGKGSTGIAVETRELRFEKLMDKFDRLTSNAQHPQQELDDERWARDAEREDAPRRQDVVRDIHALLLRLRRKVEPQRPTVPARGKGPAHGAGRGQTGPQSNHHDHRHTQDEEEEVDEDLREELQLLKRVRHFLRLQMEYLESLGLALRPRDTSLPILAMDKKTMAEIRSYASPKPIVHRVMQAALLLIGHDEATTAVWSNCKSACIPDGRDGLNRRLMKFNVFDLHPFIVERSWKILRRIRLEDVQKASPGAATFYVWASGVLRMWDYSIDDDDLEEKGSSDAKMTQREIVRREQETLRKPVTSHNDDYGYEGYHDEQPAFHGAIYSI